MPKTNIYNQGGEQVGEIELSDKVFGVKKANVALVHQALVAQMANERQVLAHTKGRSEVRGGGKKPWAQKGTGRARAGSSRSPIWIGGGVTFGPLSERNFSQKINKKMKQKAIFMALSDKLVNKKLIIVDKLDINEYKTKAFNGVVRNLENILDSGLFTKKADKGEKASKNKGVVRSVLVINHKKDEKAKYSARNLAGLKLINLGNINIVDLLKYRNLIITMDAAKSLVENNK